MKTVIITRSSREAICIVQLKEKKLIGFAWGYKIPADQELESFGIKTRRILEGDYFFIERIFIEPHADWQDTGRKLIEQILRTQTCEKVLLHIKKESLAFELIPQMGGWVVWPIQQGTRFFMQLSIKK